MEMAEEKIAQRIDANLLNVNISQLNTLTKDSFESKIIKLAKKTQGKLIIKEYPTSSAHVGHFKALLNELALKKHFHPDAIFIDYLNICASSRYKANSGVNSYSYVKSIAEEIRALAVEYNVPIISATQTGRNTTTDPDMTDVSECIFVDEKIELTDGTIKCISDASIGDQIKSQDGYKTIVMIHHKKYKDCIKVTTKSGKNIIVSKDHVFPTNKGRISYNTGLTLGDCLNSK